ncbi:LapA family protein [Acidocella sp.]|uniref:LapA family protein n=1 Tax=Acidocella sp. TaxID=50710 RepID=UPI002611CBEC|nr:LapA family protein [Acidocella sp.]
MLFVLSNRVLVPLSLWPLGGVSVWLGPLLVGTLLFGFAAGMVAGLPKHFHYRRRARAAEKKMAQLSEKDAAASAKE